MSSAGTDDLLSNAPQLLLPAPVTVHDFTLKQLVWFVMVTAAILGVALGRDSIRKCSGAGYKFLMDPFRHTEMSHSFACMIRQYVEAS